MSPINWADPWLGVKFGLLIVSPAILLLIVFGLAHLGAKSRQKKASKGKH